MTLEQLEIFKAVVQEGSFRAAADKLWKTQPAVSISIKKLEVEFGLTFFDRKNYRAKLTAEGEVFYERAQLLLSEAGQLKQLGNYLGEGHEAFLRLAVNIISPLSGLLHFLRHFFEDYCNTQLDLQFEVLHGAIEKLLNDEVDIAIAVMLESDATLDSHFLCESRLIPLAAPGVFEIDSDGFVSDEQ
ncbi:MAG: LysR family transcriptional regulator, partial [Lentisphaeraceae bacterium]|nr:LysR family transcriptional regulator [Lentisphaeraceae bacterium]